jgi:hypothetical protein
MSSKIPGYGNLVYEAPIVHTRRSGGGDSGIRHKGEGRGGEGRDAGSFNSMSPLLRNSGPHGSWQAGKLLHALIIERVFAVLCGRRGVSFQEEQVLRTSGRPLATMQPSSLLLQVAELLLDGSPGSGLAKALLGRLTGASISDLNFPASANNPVHPLQGPTTAHRCPQVRPRLQVPAEADVSARAGIAAASHPILQRYFLR